MRKRQRDRENGRLVYRVTERERKKKNRPETDLSRSKNNRTDFYLWSELNLCDGSREKNKSRKEEKGRSIIMHSFVLQYI
jgi:hypothetical protein